MENCVFCKIVSGEFDSARVWEDENFLAFLDLYPNVRGMTLVVPKKHYNSNAFEMDDEAYLQLMSAAKKVAKLLDEKLGVQRTAMVMEGMGVNHSHIKLYPLYGLEKEFKEMLAKERVFYDRYPGFIDTRLGPKADAEQLKKLAEEIRE